MDETRTEQVEIPWWLDGGWEECGFCLQTYVYEQEYRCAGCDRAVCRACVIVVATVAWCHECQREEEA